MNNETWKELGTKRTLCMRLLHAGWIYWQQTSGQWSWRLGGEGHINQKPHLYIQAPIIRYWSSILAFPFRFLPILDKHQKKKVKNSLTDRWKIIGQQHWYFT